MKPRASRAFWTVFTVITVFLVTVSSTGILEGKSRAPKLSLGDPLPANLFVELARVINPAVVNISTKVVTESMRRDPMLELLERFMGQPIRPNPGQSLGTGFVIRSDGLILTNNHVIENAGSIQVQLNEEDDELFEAEIIGRDSRTDIALIRIKTDKTLPTLQLGSSGDVKVGEWVAAFGNPFGHGHTMTKGIISAKGREIEPLNKFAFLQTDASINPGNSGGPLVNSQGYVIGVNTAIDARAQGIGFAIPIDDVKSILPELEKGGHLRRGYLGVGVEPLSPRIARYLGLSSDIQGVLVTEVAEESPAAKSGLRAYDVIVRINDKQISHPAELSRIIGDLTVDKKARVQVLRNNDLKTISIKIGKKPQSRPSNPPSSKHPSGRSAPYGLGFEVMDYSEKLADQWGLPKLAQPRPVIVQVRPNTPAARSGLRSGDILLDVNKRDVETAGDVQRYLRKSRNILRILRGNRVGLLLLEAN